MKAIGCKNLTYDETQYANSCSVSGLSDEHAVWERHGPNGFQLCQYCKLRGRINGADSCTTENKKQCNEFESYEHEVIFREKVI
jgi:hypothetical protein